MATWRKSLVVGLACALVLVPTQLQLAWAQEESEMVAASQEVPTPLPAGQPLEEESLKSIEGEGAVLAVVGLLAWGALCGWVLWEVRDHPELLIPATAVATAGAGIIGSYLGGGGGGWYRHPPSVE